MSSELSEFFNSQPNGMALPTRAAASSTPSFNKLYSELRHMVWFDYFDDFFHGKRIHEIRSVPSTSQPTTIDFVSTVVDCSTRKPLTYHELAFPCKEAYECYRWLCQHKPWVVQDTRSKVDFTMCVRCGESLPLDVHGSDYFDVLTSVRGCEVIKLGRSTLRNPPVYVNWSNDLVYLVGPLSEHAL
ncbi:hypothetical protein F5Y10DRAFT_51870 [Nemania abortiva]|nr:hypothetical protein F5Y10DRAFT_51870 [Nemania abortiva]